MSTVFRGMKGTMFNATWSITEDSIVIEKKGTYKFSDLTSIRNTPPSARWKNGVMMATTNKGDSFILPYMYDQTAEAEEAYRTIAAGANLAKDAGSKASSRSSYTSPELAQRRQEAKKSSGGIKRIIIIAVILLVAGFLIFGGGGSGSGSKNTCQVCGRSWSAGDSGGNYMSIARTHMCVNCYNNFVYAQKVSGN